MARPSVLRTQVRRSLPPVEASLEQSWTERSRRSSAITRMTKRLATYSGRLPRPPDDSISSSTPPGAGTNGWSRREVHVGPAVLGTADLAVERDDRRGVRAAYVASQHAARVIVPARRGLIVHISHWAAQKHLGNALYGIAKAATDKMASDMAHELKSHGVTVVSLYPGLVRTEGSSLLQACSIEQLRESRIHRTGCRGIGRRSRFVAFERLGRRRGGIGRTLRFCGRRWASPAAANVR